MHCNVAVIYIFKCRMAMPRREPFSLVYIHSSILKTCQQHEQVSYLEVSFKTVCLPRCGPGVRPRDNVGPLHRASCRRGGGLLSNDK